MTKEKEHSNHLVEAAAVVGGAAGLAVAGPTVGVVAAVGVAYSAAYDDGAAGEASRATGEAVLALRKKAHDYQEEHHAIEKTTEAAHKGIEDAKAYEEEHHLVERTKKAAVSSYRAIVAFERKNQLVQRSLQAVKSGANFVTEKVQQCNKDTTID
jgi:hypothetical protein